MKSSRRRNARTPVHTYESHFEHTALFEFSRVINSSLDSQFILGHILFTIMGKLICTRGMVLVAEDGRNFSVQMVKGFPATLAGTKLEVKRIPESAFDIARLDARRYPWAKWLKQQGVELLLPMFIADRPLGLLAFGKRIGHKRLLTREKTYLRSLANISATAIEKGRIIDELSQVNRSLDRRIQELKTLFELGKEFNALLDPDKLIRLLVFSLLGQIGVSRYLICLREGPDMKLSASRLDGPVLQSELLAGLANIKSPVCVEDMIVKQKTDARERLLALGMKVVIPIRLQDESKGVILLGEKLNKEKFTETDLEFLYAMGNLAIISLENAKLFKEAIEKQKLEDELLIAREIQKGLLPSVLPDIPGADIAAANISSKQVGGDYYDVIPAGESKHIVAIGDVSGKGYPAALLMANLQATIRALVPLGLGLGELTCRVNNLMCENTGGDKFVTFFWGMIDHAARTMTYVNAGHNHPYLIHGDRTMERLDKGGMILGVLKADTPYEEGHIEFRPGDLLVLFTDGVSEAMSKEGKEYGEPRLETTLLENMESPSHVITEAIHNDIQRHAKGVLQSDDITMMLLKLS